MYVYGVGTVITLLQSFFLLFLGFHKILIKLLINSIFLTKYYYYVNTKMLIFPNKCTFIILSVDFPL